MIKRLNEEICEVLGRMVGLGSREVNLKLAELGYLEGKPGAWSITEEVKSMDKSASMEMAMEVTLQEVGDALCGMRMWYT